MGNHEEQAAERLRQMGARLRGLRLQRAMTLEALSERSGWSVRQLQRVEAGEADPRWSALLTLAAALDLSLTALLEPFSRLDPNAAADTRRTFGRQLRAQREARGLTLAELAARSGITAQYLQRVENERQSPTARVILRMAVALGTRVSVLFGEAD